jgi:hypothetical protein
MCGIPQDEQLTLSNGWLSKYRLWVGLKGVKHHREAASASPEIVEKEWHQVQDIQLMDQGIIQCFKAHYHTAFIHHSVDNYDSGITPSEIYNIDQLQAMHLTQNAWLEVDTSTIWHCWEKAGILLAMTNVVPLTQSAVPVSLLVHPEDPISGAKDQLTMALDKLESTGLLQNSN